TVTGVIVLESSCSSTFPSALLYVIEPVFRSTATLMTEVAIVACSLPSCSDHSEDGHVERTIAGFVCSLNDAVGEYVSRMTDGVHTSSRIVPRCMRNTTPSACF